jgi:hypothetical protein
VALGARGRHDATILKLGGSHLRELEVATLSVVAEMVWRRHPSGQWRWDLHGKATGEGQDQCDEKFWRKIKGNGWLVGVTECGGENGSWSSCAMQKKEKVGGARLYSGGGARWGSRPGTHGAERRSRREVAAQVAGGQRLFDTTAVRDRGEETDR